MLKASLVFAAVIILLSSTAANAQLFPIGNGNNTTTNSTAIQSQIEKLQGQFQQAKKAEEHKAFLVKNRLLLPVLNLDKSKECATDQHTPTNYITFLQHFACGHVTVFQNGTVLRKFTLIVDDYHGHGTPYPITTNKIDTMFQGVYHYTANQSKFQPVLFPAWTFNGSIPGPTIRVTQGDHVQVTVINSKDSALPHSWHVHSIHAGIQDGTMSASGMIFPGSNYTYSFTAMPAGVYPYHCHMNPLQEHIVRGLYGMMIIDPPQPRPKAIEMVMVLNGYSFFMGLNGMSHLNQTAPATMQQLKQNLSSVNEADDENNGPDNNYYTVNGMVFGYTGPNMIHLTTGTQYRIYIENMLEFDPLNTFHLHGNLFTYTPSGTLQSSKIYTDIVPFVQGDRGIIEFSYPLPGLFMFHSHIVHQTDLGWLGIFNVTK